MEHIFEILLNPSGTLERFRTQPDGRGSFLTFLMGVLSVLLGLLILAQRQITFKVFLLCLAGSVAILFLLTLIKAAWLHYFAQLFGGRGKIRPFVAMLGSSCAPFIFFLPCAFLASRTSHFFAVIAGAALLAWVVALSLRSLEKNYHLQKGRAVAVVLVPSLILFVVGAAVGILTLLTLLVSLLLSLLSGVAVAF